MSPVTSGISSKCMRPSTFTLETIIGTVTTDGATIHASPRWRERDIYIVHRYFTVQNIKGEGEGEGESEGESEGEGEGEGVIPMPLGTIPPSRTGHGSACRLCPISTCVCPIRGSSLYLGGNFIDLPA